MKLCLTENIQFGTNNDMYIERWEGLANWNLTHLPICEYIATNPQNENSI